jgi:riboflavin synthase
MFTGLVEETGEIQSLEPTAAGGVRLALRAPLIGAGVQLGESVAVNGCCLTVAAYEGGVLWFDLLQETLTRTSLGGVVEGGCVNLERALAAGGRLGGHFVQGHIDGTAEVLKVSRSGADVRLEIALPPEGARYLVPKGSIAVDGISLTVAELHADRFVLWIIPHTIAVTNLRTRKTGDRVNLEYDMLAKYVERMLEHRSAGAPRG